MSRVEGAHLADLITQFAELLADSPGLGGAVPSDPAVARLVPDAYRGDAEAASEFRTLTAGDLLARRADDAGVVLAGLSPDGVPDEIDALSPLEQAELVTISLSRDTARAWLRTLAALRLVLASRLGISTEDDHEARDPRFAIYDWLGYRLDNLVTLLGD